MSKGEIKGQPTLLRPGYESPNGLGEARRPSGSGAFAARAERSVQDARR